MPLFQPFIYYLSLHLNIRDNVHDCNNTDNCSGAKPFQYILPHLNVYNLQLYIHKYDKNNDINIVAQIFKNLKFLTRKCIKYLLTGNKITVNI